MDYFQYFEDPTTLLYHIVTYIHSKKKNVQPLKKKSSEKRKNKNKNKKEEEKKSQTFFPRRFMNSCSVLKF